MVCFPRLRTVAHPLTLSLSKGVSGTRAPSAAIVLPAQAGEPRPCLPGESRGVSPLARGLGDVPPVIKKLPRAGGGAQPTSQCRPKSPPGPCPCLVSLCRFRAIFRRGSRPPFGPRPRRYDLSPFFDRFNTPQRGLRTTVRSVPGRYDLSPFVDLSVAPQSQAAPASSRHRPPGKNAQHNSKQVKSPFDQGIGGECYRASSRKGRRPAGWPLGWRVAPSVGMIDPASESRPARAAEVTYCVSLSTLPLAP